MSRSWENGSTRRWRKLRAAILADNETTNGGMCTLKLTGCTGRATQVHHVHGRRVTGDDPEHLVAACRHCNLKEGDPSSRDPAPRPRTKW